jgi:hypothetical protein
MNDVVRETCSCGASLELPNLLATNERFSSWRIIHRHEFPPAATIYNNAPAPSVEGDGK